jgi:hypothetical protein
VKRISRTKKYDRRDTPLSQHADFCIVNQTALARTVRSREHHGTSSNHVRCTHCCRLHPGLPPSGPGTTSDSPTLIAVHKALGSRGDRVRTSTVLWPLQETRGTGRERSSSSSTSSRERIGSAQESEGNPSLNGPKPQVDVASSSPRAPGRSGTAGLATKRTC